MVMSQPVGARTRSVWVTVVIATGIHEPRCFQPRKSRVETVCGEWLRLTLLYKQQRQKWPRCRLQARTSTPVSLTSPVSRPTMPSSSDLTVLSPFLRPGEKFRLKEQSVVLGHLVSAVRSEFSTPPPPPHCWSCTAGSVWSPDLCRSDGWS